jgi:hypothetical protein
MNEWSVSADGKTVLSRARERQREQSATVITLVANSYVEMSSLIWTCLPVDSTGVCQFDHG